MLSAPNGHIPALLELLLGLERVHQGAERVLGLPGDLAARFLSMHRSAVTAARAGSSMWRGIS